MKARFFGLFIVLLISIVPAFAQDMTRKGVVQVIGYENVYGTSPRMIWWWSASIIDAQGHLLTNNHVVDNGFGGTLDGFAVCITKTQWTRPDCTLTASLVARDVEKDIALLRLESTDIFWKPVNLEQLAVLPLDFSYVPTSQDKVVAIGYPRIGADTITETVWVVAWTQQFNEATYIKTDALIAGGNSGWPLIKDGKVIWVNTFGIWWAFEWSLGYALSIADAQSLIESNKTTPSDSWFLLSTFQKYLRTIYETNQQWILQDNVVSLNLKDGYRITEYEPNKLIVSYQTLPDQTSVQAFLIEHVQTPELATHEEFTYYLQKIGVYQSDYEKMKPVTIGSIPMYDIFVKNDPSEWLSQWYKKYVAQLTPTDMLFFTVQTPTYNESLYQKAKDKLDAFLSNVSFSIPTKGSSDFSSVMLKEPEITFAALPGAEKPFTRWWRASSLWSLRYSQWVLRNMLGSLHESILINVYPQTRDLWRWVGIDELMKAKTQDITTTDKATFSILWHPWFYFCQNNTVYMTTQQWNSVIGDWCQAFIVIDYQDGSLPYIVELMLQSEKKNMETNKAIFFDYLNNSINMPEINEWETMFGPWVTVEKIFNDLKNQHPDFSTTIAYLVKFKILMANRENFEWDMPMTRWDVVKIYFKWVMWVNMDEAAETCGYPINYDCLFATQTVAVRWKQVPISNIIADLKIDIWAYAANDVFEHFDTIMKLYLAGINTVSFTAWDLWTFEDLGEHLYPAEQQQLLDWEYETFWKRRIALDEVVPVWARRSPYTITWSKEFGLLKNDYGSLQPIQFNQSPMLVTDDTQALIAYCKKDISCYLRLNQINYDVVTLGELVNAIVPLMDRSQFMPELTEKKESSGYGLYDW